MWNDHGWEEHAEFEETSAESQPREGKYAAIANVALKRGELKRIVCVTSQSNIQHEY